MNRTWISRSLCILGLVGVSLLAGYSTSAIAQKPEEAAPKATARSQRLPNHYSGVVSDEQRDKIYAVQKEFESRIEEKKAELRAIVAERDKAIESILSPEQLQVVERLRAEAAAKRKARAKANAQSKAKSKDAA
ncbi:MAG: hypothetical protein DWQ37_08420 [Planctomycetota bacterium]|nr:MAG: hypothetical protein DWQ37_08420 [Planctomycetota bacterium]